MDEAPRRWTVLIDRQPQKVLHRLPRDLLQRLRQAISALADNPRPPGCKTLVGHDDLYRVRVGDWRISYAVQEDRLVVLVLEVATRGGAYRFE